MSDPDLETGRGRGPALGADLVIPVLATAFTIYFLIDSAPLVWEARANGTVIGIVLLGLVALQVGRVVLQYRSGEGHLGFGDVGALDLTQAKRVGCVLALIVFIGTISWVGTTLGIFLVMLATMWILGRRDLGWMTVIAFAAAATVYLLFIAFLETRLPAGPVERVLAPLFGLEV